MDTTYRLVKNILMDAESITLADMDSVSLQNRIDRKFIMHVRQLPAILLKILDQYRVLDINSNRIFTYRTDYFDTADFRFFKDHHNGQANRIKVRCRQYVETNSIFFEIKRKYQGTRTDKYRKCIGDMLMYLGGDEYDMIAQRYSRHNVSDLNVTLHNFFHRVTLVNKNLTERVTIDLDIRFSNEERQASLNKIVIIEIKQDKYDERSLMVQLLRKEKIYAGSISKYAYGVLMLHDTIKYNAFKPIINRVNKIQQLYGAFRHSA